METSTIWSPVVKGGNSSLQSNATVEEQLQYLHNLQSVTNQYILPTSIFLCLVAALGLPGNVLVLIVYSRKLQKTATDVLIMAMGVFDLITAGVVPCE